MEKKLSASLEDYLESIAFLAGSSGETHAADIADLMGVSRPSVTSALKSLAGKGMINYRPYSRISLTDQGKLQALLVTRKHEILTRFFTEVLGVEKKHASEAACRVEHAIGEVITDRLVQFLGFIDRCPLAEVSGFRYHSRHGKEQENAE